MSCLQKENDKISFIFLNLYTLEMILKILALGFMVPDDSYLRNPWNILDFVIVITGWIGDYQNAISVIVDHQMSD